MKRVLTTLVALAVLVPAASVRAGGYDTPILYTARHMGMGGAAISYVNDASALFHNPAGLAGVDYISVIGDFSPILGKIQSSPSDNGVSIASKPVFAPFFMLGGAFRISDDVVLGIAAYPVASAGAEYEYDYQTSAGSVTSVVDKTKIAFIEVSPGIGINLPAGLKFGFAWRATILQFERFQQQSSKTASVTILDMNMLGASFTGFKVGLQWKLPWREVEWLQLGVVYRHKTTTVVKADSSVVMTQKSGDTTMDFTLPSKLGFGLRADLLTFALALDVEYGFNSQNESSTIHATPVDPTKKDPAVVSYYEWRNSWTVRLGLQYTLKDVFYGSKLDQMFFRLGYIWDDKVSNTHYPSAFGTPPAPTNTFTVGTGFKFWLMQVNLAYALRLGPTTPITAADLDYKTLGLPSCPTCGKAGDYKLTMHAAYCDISFDFERPSTPPPPDQPMPLPPANDVEMPN